MQRTKLKYYVHKDPIKLDPCARHLDVKHITIVEQMIRIGPHKLVFMQSTHKTARKNYAFVKNNAAIVATNKLPYTVASESLKKR